MAKYRVKGKEHNVIESKFMRDNCDQYDDRRSAELWTRRSEAKARD